MVLINPMMLNDNNIIPAVNYVNHQMLFSPLARSTFIISRALFNQLQSYIENPRLSEERRSLCHRELSVLSRYIIRASEFFPDLG